MRKLFLTIALTMFASASALAQSWMEYTYTDAGFAVQFPETPTVTKAAYKTAGGRTAPATVYSAKRGSSIYSITVVDLSKAPDSQANAIDDAVKVLKDTGEIKVDVNERVDGQRGHELSVTGKDGSQSTFAVFAADQKLYQLEAKVLPPNPQAGSGDALRFQQSLRFIGKAAGRGFGPPGAGFGPGRFGPPGFRAAFQGGYGRGGRVSDNPAPDEE